MAEFVRVREKAGRVAVWDVINNKVDKFFALMPELGEIKPTRVPLETGDKNAWCRCPWCKGNRYVLSLKTGISTCMSLGCEKSWEGVSPIELYCKVQQGNNRALSYKEAYKEIVNAMS